MLVHPHGNGLCLLAPANVLLATGLLRCLGGQAHLVDVQQAVDGAREAENPASLDGGSVGRHLHQMPAVNSKT